MSQLFAFIVRSFWPFWAIFLGVWEISALLTGKRIPTITATCYWAQGKNKMAARFLIGLWLLGLGRHLLGSSDEN